MSMLKLSDPRDIKFDPTANGIFTDPGGGKGTNTKLLDSDWLTSMFAVSNDDVESIDKTHRTWCSADNMFTSTGLGEAIGVNPYPKFCPYADITSKGKIKSRPDFTIHSDVSKTGEGMFYASAFTSVRPILHLEFGVPHFTNLLSFLGRSVDRKASVMANEGRLGLGVEIGQALGTVALIVMFPGVRLLAAGLFKGVTMLMDAPSNKYYTLKPAMHVYFGLVNTLTNLMAQEIGFVSETIASKDPGKIGVGKKLDAESLAQIRELVPDLISEEGNIDTFAMVTKGQRQYTQMLFREAEAMRNGNLGMDAMRGFINTEFSEQPNYSYAEFVRNLFTPESSYKPLPEKAIEAAIPEIIDNVTSFFDSDNEGNYNASEAEKKKKHTATLAAHYSAVNKGGARFASFFVEPINSTSESFTNSTKETPVSGFLNGFGSKGRDIQFSLKGGNILGDTIGSFVGNAADVAIGALGAASFGLTNVIMGLFEGGFIDIPKMWSGASLDISSQRFKLELVPSTAHPYDLLMSQFIPTAMVLAGTLPLSTGMTSFTSPLLCKSFIQGIQEIDLGMIGNVSIERGNKSLPWDDYGRSIGVTITFDIIDFSSIMSGSVDPTLSGGFNMSKGEDDTMVKYIGMLAGRNLANTKYSGNKWARKLLHLSKTVDAISSPAYWGMQFSAGNPLNIESWFASPINAAKTAGMSNDIDGLAIGVKNAWESGKRMVGTATLVE